MGHICSSILLFSLASDVLCPSVHVEGDRFKHTNGESKEITGEKARAAASLPRCAVCQACALPDSGPASLICSPGSHGTAEPRGQSPTRSPRTVSSSRISIWEPMVTLWEPLNNTSEETSRRMSKGDRRSEQTRGEISAFRVRV